MMLSPRPSLFVLLTSGVLFAACSNSNDSNDPDPTPEPQPLVPASLQIVSGNQQHGIINQVLPAAVVVQLLGASGHPVPGRALTFQVISGQGRISQDTARTNASGT